MVSEELLILASCLLRPIYINIIAGQVNAKLTLDATHA